METKQVDIAIIGSGTAGLNALSKVKPSGKSFVLINGGEPGTTCARVGCMPSKALIQVAEDYHRRTTLARYGIDGHAGITLDIPEALEYVQDMRDNFVDRVLSSSTDDMGEEFIQGYARFIDTNTLQIDDKYLIKADRIVIATGSTPVVPAAWQVFGDRVLTTDTLFEQESLPGSIAVIGLGVIGLELGQSLQRIGVQVTGFDQASEIGGAQDPQVCQLALEILGKEFPIHLGQAVELAGAADGRILVSNGETSVEVDKVLCCIGRRPNLAGLGLENLPVSLDDRGVPRHDPNSMQVGDLPVFIAGDASGARPILHEAGDEGKIAGRNAVSEDIRKFRRKTPLYINFCDPNICFVGVRWNDLPDGGYAVGEMRMNPVGRAQIMAKNQGIIRVYAESASGRLLGAEIIGAKGENLAHLLCWCIEQGLTAGQLLRMPFYHPVIEEALQAALYNLYGKLDDSARNSGSITELYEL